MKHFTEMDPIGHGHFLVLQDFFMSQFLSCRLMFRLNKNYAPPARTEHCRQWNCSAQMQFENTKKVRQHCDFCSASFNFFCRWCLGLFCRWLKMIMKIALGLLQFPTSVLCKAFVNVAEKQHVKKEQPRYSRVSICIRRQYHNDNTLMFPPPIYDKMHFQCITSIWIHTCFL